MVQTVETVEIVETPVERLECRRLLSGGTPGGLDRSFSGDGMASVDFSPQLVLMRALTVQADGKVVEVGNTTHLGSTSSGGGLLAIARLNADGSPDTTFGPTHSGKIAIGYGGANDDIVGYAVAVQADGKIVVAASRGFNDTFDVLRFNADGSFDNTFDGDGVVNVDVGFGVEGHPKALALQSDGKIVVVGEKREGVFSSDDDFLVVRLTTTGGLDSTFGDRFENTSFRTGLTTADFGGSEEATAVAIDYNGTAATNGDFGRIVVAGNRTDFGDTDTRTVAVARFQPNGTLDGSFDGDGKRLAGLAGDPYASANGVVIKPSGYVVTVGGFAPGFDPLIDRGFLLRGFTNTGADDPNFGNGGVVKTNFAPGTSAEAFAAVNGFAQRIIVAGHADDQYALAAYTLDGKLDPGFGSGGTVMMPGLHYPGIDSDPDDPFVSLAVGSNRTVVAGGGVGFNAARYFDFAPVVSLLALNPTAQEQGPSPVTFFVLRDVRLDVATRVYFTIGGTATSPTTFAIAHNQNDYTLDGLVIPGFVIIGQNPQPYVDIPAGQTFAVVTLTPVDDTAAEGTETATFTVTADPLYDPGSPTAAAFNILDNDASAAAPPAWLSVPANCVWSFTGPAGGKTLSLDSGAFTITADPAVTDPGTSVSVAAPASVAVNASAHLAGLALTGGAAATLSGVGAGRTATNHHILVTSALIIDTAAGSRLDLADNDLVLKGGGAAGLASIQSLISSGYAKHAWTGAGIVSSAAAGKTTNALGYALNDGSVIKAKTTFGPNAEPVGPTDVLVKYTYEGDANVDGQVSFDDYFFIDSKYPKPSNSTWVTGDFDYNAQTSFDDYFYIDSNYPKNVAL